MTARPRAQSTSHGASCRLQQAHRVDKAANAILRPLRASTRLLQRTRDLSLSDGGGGVRLIVKLRTHQRTVSAALDLPVESVGTLCAGAGLSWPAAPGVGGVLLPGLSARWKLRVWDREVLARP